MTTPETTVRQIALEHPASIRVFEKFGIDYCCGGRKPLAQVCEERSLQMGALLAAIENANQAQTSNTTDWTTASLEALCVHIVKTHHHYVHNEIQRLWQLAQKVVARHGADRPELAEMQQLTKSVGEDLVQHLSKEESMLFPCITNLERNLASCGPRALGPSGIPFRS